MRFFKKKTTIPSEQEALPGRDTKISAPDRHYVNGNPMQPPFPEHVEFALFGMGCFWGAERKFWEAPGVFSTSVGYAAGHTLNPTYEEVCSGLTGHNEVVQAIFDTHRIGYAHLLQIFWENHDPTQGMRQGNDVGTQYRSGIYVYSSAQKSAALASLDAFQKELKRLGHGQITTEIIDAPAYYYAEDYHQQYLAKNPLGYCGLGGMGVRCPLPASA